MSHDFVQTSKLVSRNNYLHDGCVLELKKKIMPNLDISVKKVWTIKLFFFYCASKTFELATLLEKKAIVWAKNLFRYFINSVSSIQGDHEKDDPSFHRILRELRM